MPGLGGADAGSRAVDRVKSACAESRTGKGYEGMCVTGRGGNV